MTNKEFLAKLAGSKGEFELVRAPVTHRRRNEHVTSIVNGVIRAKGSAGEIFCPITKVAHELTGCFFPTDKVFEAAEAIQLGIYDTGGIITAADNSCNKEFELRIEMLKVLGLQERKSA